MKIGVDIRVLMDEYYSGVSEYTANLLAAILRLDAINDYRLFYNSYHDFDQRFRAWNSARAKVIGTHWPNKVFNYLLQKTLAWPKIDRVLGGTDVFWSPHFNFTRLSARPGGPRRIVTVHDLSFLRYPEFFSGRKNLWHRTLSVRETLRAADKVIAVSENTKNDIVELAGVRPDKVRVIYSGNNVIKREVGAEEAREFLVKHSLMGSAALKPAAGRFILYLGNIEPRKNIRGLIEAFNLLRDKEAARGDQSDLRLLLAGADGWKNKDIYAAWRRSPYQDDIKFLGYISKKEKEILYSISSVFVYPSYYEGFGFPPLEAMAYGLPVVCSNVSSLPEVVGGAALMINPFKPEEIARALEFALDDSRVRSRLIAAGYERARFFSWEKAAAEYLKVFDEYYESKK
ncbi:MAG: glycosyltransferase family 1 protein [Patescibacteria group bacterium]